MSKKKSTTAATVTVEQPVNFRKYYYILGILVFFLFANTIGNGYNLDDEIVTRNHKLTSRGLEAVGDIFTSPYYSDDMGYAYGYRPMVHLSFAIEHALFGEKPGVSHFINVLLYVFSVILFFKLLLKWTGEKGLALALIAVTLFAVHPVHSEAVASIKNRDEILAFLFVILSALSFQKFISKSRFISLFWILLFFICAMLSKKSVVPMAILLPVIAIFIQKIPLKELILSSACFLVPAALIGSEMEVYRCLLIGLSIAGSIAAAFFLNLLLIRLPHWKLVLKDYRLYSVTSVAIFSYAVYDHKLILAYLALLILVPFSFKKKREISLLLIGEMLIAAYWFEGHELAQAGFFISLYITMENFFIQRKDWALWAITALYVGLLVWINFEFNVVYLIGASLFFLYFIHRKWLVAVVYSLLVLSISLYQGNGISVYPILLLMVAALQILKVYWKAFDLLPFLLAGSLTISLVYDINYWRIEFQQSSMQVSTVGKSLPELVQPKVFENASILKEGRSLEMIENTLVLPHTRSETIGTGAATLGEYMRLMIFPYELSFYYGYAKTKTVSLNNPWVWISVILHLSLVLLAFWQLKKRPLLSIGIAWYLLSILLFSNWVELVAGMVGERLAFTASAGFCIFIAGLLLWIKPEFSIKKPGLVEYSVLAIVVVFAGRTFVRNSNWKTPLTLMSNDIQHLHNSAQANNLYALKLMESSFTATDETLEGNQAKQRLAIQHFEKALEIWPEFFNAAYDKGRAGMSLTDTLIAIDGFEKAVAIGNTDFTDPYYQLGDLYLLKKRNQDFLSVAKKLYSAHGDKSDSYSFLARGYFLNGYIDSATQILNLGIARFPSDHNLQKNLELISVK